MTGPTPTTPDRSAHEVKGTWFVTARRLIDLDGGDAAVTAQLSDPTRAILADPLASEWYPEEALAELLAALRSGLAGGDVDRFTGILEKACELGVNRFLTGILRLSTPSFMLGRVPTLWTMLRRGPAHVRVERGESASRLHYADFPFFDDDNYRRLTCASVVVMLRLTGIDTPRVRVVGATHDSLTVLADHG